MVAIQKAGVVASMVKLAVTSQPPGGLKAPIIVVAADADVDTLNLHLLLGGELVEEKRLATSEKAQIDQSVCERCGKCYESCAFNSIRKIDGGYVVAPAYCEGCSVYEAICPAGAIEVKSIENGKIRVFRSRFGFPLIVGQLDVGSSGSGEVISEVKEEARRFAGRVRASLLLVDGPPGAGCSAISAISRSSHVLLVAEPTKAARHDLERVLGIVDHFGATFGVVTNRFNANPEMSPEISRLVEGRGGEVLSLIPSDEEVVHAIVNGQPVVERSPEPSFKSHNGGV
ncbi:MAG: hypothetical protein KIH01_06840 [Candidatus Freyarchaeota archaeon]|nr:hypothetical protein [Candidatus Jordarchaeia archaeon]